MTTKTAHFLSSLKGKTIMRVEALNSREIDELGWCCDPYETTLITFTDGTGAILMADPEGNGPGWLEMVEMA